MIEMVSRRGVSLLELIVTMAILAIAFTITALNLRPLGDDLGNAVAEISGTLKQSKIKAMATTSAYRIRPTSTTQVMVERARDCTGAGNWTAQPTLAQTLREGVTFTTTNWTVCFNSRGQSLSNVGAFQSPSFTLRDKENKTQTIQVFIAGAVVAQ
jgi:prepilin-type N-terminal cleavage/methylation domain-containing protein